MADYSISAGDLIYPLNLRFHIIKVMGKRPYDGFSD
jgi:hypothetical protein